MVEVAGFRVLVSFARDVAEAKLPAHGLHFVTLAVVEHERLVRISNRPRTNGCATKKLERLVVAGDEDVGLDTLWRRRRLATHDAPRCEDERGHRHHSP